ncbi:peroxidase [Streptococcus pneumoniae]|nr:peroxidase [Streptococcus pneumoniae]
MQKNIYFVVLDLHTTDRDKIIQLFKDWTDYSAKLVEGELVKKDGQNALFPPSDTGETVRLNPYRLTLTFGVSASFLKRMNLENKRPRLFRDLPLFPKEQLREKYTGGDIVIHACADDEQIAMAVRRIQMFLETWDRTSLEEQENTFGRYKESGAPFGKKNEFDEVDLSLLPDDSHVCLAKEVDKPLLRRSYSYSDGIDEKTGQFDTGLLFISFQKDPDNFVKVQTNLGATDKMNEYITHIGSGLFTCFGGVEKGGYIGQKLLEG